jgi:hypothetical protein
MSRLGGRNCVRSTDDRKGPERSRNQGGPSEGTEETEGPGVTPTLTGPVRSAPLTEAVKQIGVKSPLE